MKKLLNILGIIYFIGINTIILISCNTTPQYNKEQLKELKEKNNIKTKDGILEWIVSQENPFKKIDNKYYFVIWRINNNDNWRIVKFKNNKYLDPYLIEEKILDEYNTYNLKLKVKGWPDLVANKNIFYNFWWEIDDGSNFKAVYRWNNNNEPNINIKNKLKDYLEL